MNLALREYVRKYFSDFRYLSSDAEPEILREFVRYEEVIDFVKQFGKDQQLSGFYDAYLRMPTEEEGLEEAMKYIDKNMPPCTAFLEGIKYAWKMFSTPRSGEYLENIDKNTSPELAQQYLDNLPKATMD